LNQILLILDDRYARRMAADGTGWITVYGDFWHTLRLGRVKEQSQAVKMLDAYDSNFNRRKVIADMIDELRAKGPPPTNPEK